MLFLIDPDYFNNLQIIKIIMKLKLFTILHALDVYYFNPLIHMTRNGRHLLCIKRIGRIKKIYIFISHFGR